MNVIDEIVRLFDAEKIGMDEATCRMSAAFCVGMIDQQEYRDGLWQIGCPEQMEDGTCAF
jgi:hypothetical protein